MFNNLITIPGHIHSVFIASPTKNSPSFRVNIAVKKHEADRLEMEIDRILQSRNMGAGYINHLLHPVIEDANSSYIPKLEMYTKTRLTQKKAQVVPEDYKAPDYLKDTSIFIVRLGSVDRIGYCADDKNPALPPLFHEMYDVVDNMWSKTTEAPGSGSLVKLVCSPDAYVNKHGRQFSFNPNTLFILNRVDPPVGYKMPDREERFAAAGVDINSEALADALRHEEAPSSLYGGDDDVYVT